VSESGTTGAGPEGPALLTCGRGVEHRAIVGVDVGGTFTDFAVVGPTGLVVDKRLSSPGDPSETVLAGLMGLDPDAAMDVAHGTTVATNVLLERRGSRTAFVTTAGFADLLAIGRGTRADLYALAPRSPPNLVPPELCFEVDERVGADGIPIRRLDDAASAEVALQVAAVGAESVAVCLLFSYLYPEHERSVGEALAAVPDGPEHVSLSVDVLSEFREYERASTVVVNAYVAPVLQRYIDRLVRTAAPRRLVVMGSHGGTLSPSEATRLPAATVLSGPAAGVGGALAVAQRVGHERIITLDMGGTSTDVALCDGEVPFSASTVIDGLPIQLPAVDIHTVGAGGGSIVRTDEGGAMRVGPQSAGADPGPAAYGRGGRYATITDAHVCLGRLPADAPLAGGLQLDVSAAGSVLGAVAAELGVGVEDAALGALAIVNAAMERALRRVSVERGFAPREFTLVAFGGAGPLHACELADAIDAGGVLVPAAPGALSALGLATAAPVALASRSVLRPPGAGEVDLQAVFQDLERAGREALGNPADVDVERLADVRYVGQSWELTVPWPRAADPVAAFEAAHDRRYGYARPGAPTEIVTLRVRVRAPAAAPLPPAPAPVAGPAGATDMVLPDGRRVTCRVQPRWALLPGDSVDGPIVLTQQDTTTFVAPGWTARAGAWGDLELRRV